MYHVIFYLDCKEFVTESMQGIIYTMLHSLYVLCNCQETFTCFHIKEHFIYSTDIISGILANLSHKHTRLMFTSMQ